LNNKITKEQSFTAKYVDRMKKGESLFTRIARINTNSTDYTKKGSQQRNEGTKGFELLQKITKITEITEI